MAYINETGFQNVHGRYAQRECGHEINPYICYSGDMVRVWMLYQKVITYFPYTCYIDTGYYFTVKSY